MKAKLAIVPVLTAIVLLSWVAPIRATTTEKTGLKLVDKENPDNYRCQITDCCDGWPCSQTGPSCCTIS